MRVATTIALLLIATGIFAFYLPEEARELPLTATAGPDEAALGNLPPEDATPEERRTILSHVPQDHPFDPLAAIPAPAVRVTQEVVDDLERFRLLLRARPEFLAYGLDFTPDLLTELRQSAAREIEALTAAVEVYEEAFRAWRSSVPPATREGFVDLVAARTRFEPRLHGHDDRPCRILAYRYANGLHVPLVADPFRDQRLYHLHADVVALSKIVHDKFTEILILRQADKQPR